MLYHHWDQGHSHWNFALKILIKVFFYFFVWKQLRQIGGWTSVSLVTLTCGSWSEGQHDPCFTVQKCLPYILKTIWCMNIILWDYESVWPDVLPQNKCRSLWSIFHGQWFCLISWRLFDVWTSDIRIMSEYDQTFDLKINVGHCDLYFMVQWFWLDILNIKCMNIILWDYEWVWHNIWPLNKCWSLWPIFHGPVILPYFLKTIWYMNTILWDYESVWPYVWPQNICSTLWLYFMVQWFCLISWKLFSGWTSYFGIMSRYDPTCDLQIFVGHCDLYFMVHWICPLSWRLFDVWTSYFRIMRQYDMAFDLKINVGHCDICFMVQWFCLIS